MAFKGKEKSCIVIGAGIAGIAASIRLAAAGFKVRVYEKNESPGGKISEKRMGAFRFDTGPSLLTCPEYIGELFELFDKPAGNYIRFIQPDPVSRYYFPDDSWIDTYADKPKFAGELSGKRVRDSEKVFVVLRDAGNIYDLTREVFLERSLHKVRNYFNWPTLRGLLNFHRIHAFESMHRYNSRKLKDARLVRIFDRFANYVGSDPFKAPATLNVISHLELNRGVYVAEGGMYQVVRALVKLAEEAGVEIHTGMPADKIVVENKRVKGAVIAGSFVESDYVICNADIHNTYHKLLPEIKAPEFVLRQGASSSVLVFLWSMHRSVPGIELHTTFFGKDDESEYRAVFGEKTICSEPTIYVYNSSRAVPEDAPPGKSNWFVMITAPGHEGQNWDEMVDKSRRYILRKLSHVLKENIEALIEAEEILTPVHFMEMTHSRKGAIYGNNSNGIFSAFLRHPNFSNRIGGLYFCGGSVHPGAGIPLCLLSAKIATGMILRKEKKR